MFGGLAFLISGNMAVAASGQGGLMVRVDPAEGEDLIATTPARPMEMRGASMSGWLRLASDDVRVKRQLEKWVAAASRTRRPFPEVGRRMTSRLVALCVDANDAPRLARFWAAALRWEIAHEASDEVRLAPTDDTGFDLVFVRVPESKVGRNRIHFDLTTASLDDQRVRYVIDRARRSAHRRRSDRRRRTRRVGRSRGQRVLPDRALERVSSPAARGSVRCPATVHELSDSSGVRRSTGRWCGTRARRPRSERRATEAPSSRGAVARSSRSSARVGFISTSHDRRRSGGRSGPLARPRREARRHRPRVRQLGGDG